MDFMYELTERMDGTALLLDEDGEKVELSLLGTGSFSTVYKVENSSNDEDIGKVYVLNWSSFDPVKHIMSSLSGQNPHIPDTEFMGELFEDIENVEPWEEAQAQVFRMERYYPLDDGRPHFVSKDDWQRAWEMSSILEECASDAYDMIEELSKTGEVYRRIEDYGYEQMEHIAECVKSEKYDLPESVKEAISLIAREGKSTTFADNVFFEFPARNLAVDKNGTLILLDVVFFGAQVF